MEENIYCTKYCIVTNCRQGGDKGFFALPKPLEKKKKWLDSLKLSDWFLNHSSQDQSEEGQQQNRKKKMPTYHYICFRHFKKCHFNLSGKRVTLTAGWYTIHIQKCFYYTTYIT